MKRRKFIQWLAGVAATVALNPVIVWGAERAKILKVRWSPEAAVELKSYHTVEEERRLEQALMEEMAKAFTQDYERAFVMNEREQPEEALRIGYESCRAVVDVKEVKALDAMFEKAKRAYVDRAAERNRLDLAHHDFATAMGSALNDEIKKRLG